MSELISAFILAVIQGITEWLPVSSKGHLILFEKILGYNKGGLAFDVALHFGTLMAVFVYFGKDITDILQDWLKGKWKTENSRLGFLVFIATIPAAVVGFIFKKYFEMAFANFLILAIGFGVTGLVVIIASLDIKFKEQELGYKSALGIGIAQVFALFPGVSRSGTTISSGILLGLDQKKAMKFSFLMSIPIVFGANLVAVGGRKIPSEYIWPTLVSFLVGLITIHILYKYVSTSRKNLRWFGIYALLLALGIFIWIIFI